MRTGTVRTATGGLTGRPNWLLFSPDGETVVSTNLDGTVTLWDAESATSQETLRGHWNSVQQPVFSPDGETLYTASHDGTAIAWDLRATAGSAAVHVHARPDVLRAGYDGHPGEFSPDGRLIAVGLKGQGVALWDALELMPVGAAPSRDGRRGQGARLLTGWASACGGDPTGGALTLWDVGSRSRIPGA